MMVGRRCTVCLGFFLMLACSTEDSGLYSYDAANTAQQTGEGDPIDSSVARPDRPIDRKPPPVDASVDAPVAADVAPDKPPPTDQPLGAACAKNAECHGNNCVDGVCCDGACNDGCSACNQARTGRPDGTCAMASDLEGKACGRKCSTTSANTLLEKVCMAGACVLPAHPVVVETCRDGGDPCAVAFCDDNEGRCVKTTCQQGSCCCRATNGDRMCAKVDQCKGSKVCE
jgi:hypothetical protein